MIILVTLNNVPSTLYNNNLGSWYLSALVYGATDWCKVRQNQRLYIISKLSIALPDHDPLHAGAYRLEIISACAKRVWQRDTTVIYIINLLYKLALP